MNKLSKDNIELLLRNLQGSFWDRNRNYIRLFDNLASSRYYEHLHQLSGWVEISEYSTWEDYVSQVLSNTVKSGDVVFEAGCGTLAFLNALRRNYDNISIAGVDASYHAIQKIKHDVAPSESEKFFLGDITKNIALMPSSSCNITICHSVLQYLNSHWNAAFVIYQLLRITRIGGTLIIGDLLSASHIDEITVEMSEKYSIDATPLKFLFLFYSKTWVFEIQEMISNIDRFSVKLAFKESANGRFHTYFYKMRPSDG